MNQLKLSPHQPAGSISDKMHHPPGHKPYWKRAHRSWQFWLAIFLMLAAMTIYLMSNDLAGWTDHQQRQPINL